MAEPYTTADFHNLVHKQLVLAASDALAAAKIEWEQVRPLLDAARSICRTEIEQGGRLSLHAVAGEEGKEAYLSFAVAGQDDGADWAGRSWWLSDAILATADPDEVRRNIAAAERSLERARAWLAEQEAPPPAGAEEGAASPQ